MFGKDEPKGCPGEMAATKRREWPGLVLEIERVGAPTFVSIDADHPLYGLAAWVFHHADGLDPWSRRGLFDSLERVWPRRGRRKTPPQRQLFMMALLDAGVDQDLIAKEWNYTSGHIGDLARDVKRPLGALSLPDAERNRVAATPVGPDTPEEPFDPASVTGRIEQLNTGETEGTDDWDRADAVAQQAGFDSFVSLVAAPKKDRKA